MAVRLSTQLYIEAVSLIEYKKWNSFLCWWGKEITGVMCWHIIIAGEPCAKKNLDKSRRGDGYIGYTDRP